MDDIVCDECGKKFSSAESLQQHRNAKHTDKSKKQARPSKFKTKYLMYLVIFLIVSGIIYFAYDRAKAPGKYDEFAKCLNEKDVKFYGAYWCPSCAEQKRIFGKSAKYLDYIECSLPNRGGQTQICIDEKIQGYPTWELPTGEKITGVMSLERLAEMS